MNLDELKNRIKSAYKELNLTELLDKEVSIKELQLRKEFENIKSFNPSIELNSWKVDKIESINKNTTNTNDLLVIGAYLLALDKL